MEPDKIHIEEVGAQEYAALFPAGSPGTHLYNSVPFTQLMAHVADDVRYLAFSQGGKVRAGIILGERVGVLRSPFSAPFGGMSFVKEPSVELVCRCVDALARYARPRPLGITVPPPCYFPTLVPKMQMAHEALEAHSGRVVDINYHYPLERTLRCEEYMDRSARKNLHRGCEAGFTVKVLDSANADDMKRAYEVIRSNREAHGYPLRMSLQQIIDTAPVAQAQIVVMSLGDDDVAAALLHRVTADVAQVVYWGDAPGYSHLRPMNYFALEVMRICYAGGYSVLDIGPSSEDGVPSFGLCRFKEDIGCVPTLKVRYEIFT